MNYSRRQRITDTKLKNRGDYILYWMQAAQRTKENHALDEAIELANHYQRPLMVVCIIDETFKDGNRRNFKFMLEGLSDVQTGLKRLGAQFLVKRSDFVQGLTPLLKDATALVMDDAYLKELRAIKSTLSSKAQGLGVPVFYVPSNVIIPIEQASDKLEYAARTIRKKLMQQTKDWSQPLDIKTLDEKKTQKNSSLPDLKTLKVKDIAGSTVLKGGEQNALSQLQKFLDEGLKAYETKSFDPAASHAVSYLSAYLHFGHIAPTLIWREVKKKAALDERLNASVEAFLEQLLVRRELAYNYVWYLDGYDRFETMTVPWAYETMEKHKHDKRLYLYTKADYLNMNTHDDYFNAAMRQMLKTGYMHNRMRMYWGKKIIEWSRDYKTAYETILDLNNTYFLDGRDPVSYASVAWCFGRHDQAWKEREIFGKLRYMNAAGLRRKSAIDTYLKRWSKD